jgi:DNA-binding NarL/FixJ family response regulator
LRPDTLRAREREVLELMAEGRTNRAIAAKLFLSERAVERYVTSIFAKLNLPRPRRTTGGLLAVLAYLRG